MWLLQVAADVVLVLHFCIAAFVVLGLLLVWAGHGLGWHWVDGWWFRLAHAAAIAVVVAESWLGIVCPLTTLESWLRVKASAAPYTRGFVVDWVQRLLFYDAPEWVFTTAYSLFGLLVALTWWFFPPGAGRAGPGAK